MNKRANQPIEAGNPADDPRMFRRCLGQFGTGVAIITTRSHGQNAGVTVNSVASVSLEPPLVLWSISRGSRSYGAFQNAPGFAINILSKDQIELSRHFSSSVADKFAGVPSRYGNHDIPLLDGAVAHLECSREAAYDGGDHVIMIGHVSRISRYGGDPLLFVQGRYVVAADHPDADAAASTAANATPASQFAADFGLIPLLFEAHHALSAKFDEHRRAEGLSRTVARILAALRDSPGLSADALAGKAYIGIRDAEDALAELCLRGQAARVANGEYALTHAGRERCEAIKRRWLDFQSAEMAGISQGEMNGVSNVLAKLLANAEELRRVS
jgi:flavin reductase (DIM6/NTAB) family NADH-FMN oxidoreductase RutF/DNA-binding MarR family transcriptional regulator